MKLFLLEDLRGKGKAYECIEVKGGYANFLIRAGKALDYENNKEQINELLAKRDEEEESRLATAYRLSDALKGYVITLNGKLSPKGSLIRKITKNDILENLPALFHDTINKNMLQMENITAPGTYDIPVKLYKQVMGSVRVKVEVNE